MLALVLMNVGIYYTIIASDPAQFPGARALHIRNNSFSKQSGILVKVVLLQT
jgi:hypothetical protein